MSTIFSNKAQRSPMFATLPVALFLHGVLVFATGFMTPEPNIANKSTLLDITIVHTDSDVAPKDADFVALLATSVQRPCDQSNYITSISTNIKMRNVFTTMLLTTSRKFSDRMAK